MNNVIGVIFADSHYTDIKELTRVRPLGALPISGRYRIIDFVLSNMVNSGMINISVVTQNNYHSLMGHLGSGKHWNLARKRYGLTLFPPFSNISSTGSDSRIDILYGVLDFLKRSKQEYVLLAESHVLTNMKFNELFEKHKASNADITMVCRKIENSEENNPLDTYIYTDEDGNITSVEQGENLANANYKYFGYVLINKQVLINIIERSKVRGKKGYLTNLIARNIGTLNIKVSNFEGYGKMVKSVNDYYNTSMDILNKDVRDELFNKDHPIYTKDKDSTPTRHLANAQVSNSLVADGCVIDGKVVNSIISRGVRVKKGCVIENSIIMQQSDIGEDVHLKNVIIDKKVIIRDNKELVGTEDFPILVGKGRIV